MDVLDDLRPKPLTTPFFFFFLVLREKRIEASQSNNVTYRFKDEGQGLLNL